MNKAEIKKAIGLPHVKTAYVKGDKIFIHPVHGAQKVDLSDVTDEELEALEVKDGEQAAIDAKEAADKAKADADKEAADKKAAADKAKADADKKVK